MVRTRIWVICGIALLAGLPVISYAASFSCAKATSPNRLMICVPINNCRVIDDDLAALYRAAKAAAPDAVAFKEGDER